jgi:two-component system, sensor histidine kinase and response regulator
MSQAGRSRHRTSTFPVPGAGQSKLNSKTLIAHWDLLARAGIAVSGTMLGYEVLKDYLTVSGVLVLSHWQAHLITIVLSTAGTMLAAAYVAKRLDQIHAPAVEAERTLIQERNLLRAISDTLPDGIYATDADGCFLLANNAFAGCYGLESSASLAGKTASDLFPEKIAAAFQESDRQVMAGEQLIEREESFAEGGENTRWRLVTKVPLRDNHGVARGVVGLIRDITHKKQEEERNWLLAQAVESSSELIGLGDERGRVIFANPALLHAIGFSRDEVIGKPFVASIFSPNNDASLQQEITASMRNSGSWKGECLERREDGTDVPVDLRIDLIKDKAGRPIGTLGIARDISLRKEAEEAMLRAKEAAETANRAKSEFLANMSHEIRTPMNGIMGMTELVLDTNLDPEQRNYLNLAKSSALSLLSLINDILDYSKIEAGKLEIEAINFQLGSCLGETMKTLSLRAHQKGLELAFEIDPDVNDALVGDPGRLRQVVVNLVGNAIKFTEKGEVVLHVESSARREEGIELHFTVRDTGIGIPKDKQEAVFGAFQQADGSMTRKYGGTGLGLTISSRLVQLMGGRIWVESDETKGSCFHFTALFELPKNPIRTIVPRDPETLRGMRVLIVDDNSTNRQILIKMLDNWHATPYAVDSGAQAIVTLREASSMGRSFQLILVDAQMPEMDGFALIEAIKRNPQWNAATIMMLSSAGQKGDAMHCRELGVAAYLTKPVQQDELLDATLAALGTRQSQNVQPDLVTRHSLNENRVSLRVLLAEDNPVNQLVALRILEKRGHKVTVAANGRKALAALGQESYDAVLMDVQMPEMNGFEATREIRAQERGTNKRLPIVAMTAHAMKGDEERCLEAGMDFYLTKPIQSAELFLVLDKIAGSKPISAARQDKFAPEQRSGALDVEAALQRIDGDRELLAQIAQLFRDECPNTIEAIRAAILQENRTALERQAHSLKGSSSNLGAVAVSKAAGQLERVARNGEMQQAREEFKILEVEVDRMMCELEALCTE